MRIQINQIDTEQFNVQEREHPLLGTVVLINPSKSKHSWASDELHLRSLLCRPDGTILCSGFPKFKNVSECPETDAITKASVLSEYPTYFPEKMDGSLIIRTVIDGHVCFRTRGSHWLGDFEEPIMFMISSKYPRLLDAEYCSEVTCLFEYTSPDNRIVIPYEESELTFLGQMHYGEQHPWFVGTPELISMVSRETGVRHLKFHQLPSNVRELRTEIAGWKNSEGIVIWSVLPSGKMHLAKIKASEYIRLHSIKFQLSDRKVQQLCWFRGISSHEDLERELYSFGVDWESMSFVIPALEEYLQRKERYSNLVTDFISRVRSDGIDSFPSRKDIALALKSLSSSVANDSIEQRALFNVGINYCTDKQEQVPLIIDALILGVSVGRLKSYGLEAEQMMDSFIPKE